MGCDFFGEFCLTQAYNLLYNHFVIKKGKKFGSTNSPDCKLAIGKEALNFRIGGY